MFTQWLRAWAETGIHAVQAHGRKTLAALTALATVAALVLVAAPAHAEETRIADPTTFTQWEQGMGDPTDPRSTGRVWTDKSVSTESVTLKTYDGKDVTVAPEEGSFLVGLSAMSSAQKLIGVSNVTKPLDIVLVLDTSGSMNFNMAGESVLGYERIYSNSSNFSTNKTYYIKDGSEYYEVYYDSSFGWYYWKGENWYTVTPKSSAQDWQNTQFYEGIPIPEADRRMTALKQASTVSSMRQSPPTAR